MASSCIFADAFERVGSVQTLFRSLGTGTRGDLASWTTVSGSPSIAANVVTLPNGCRIKAGHIDWWDKTVQTRFKWVTGGNGILNIRYTDDNNRIYIVADGVNLYVNKVVGGVITGVAAAIATPLVNNTQYWFQVTAAGTTITAKVFADNAGAINLASQVGGTTSGQATDAVLATGQIALESGTYGGAFANVCQVTGPTPLGWVNSATLNAGSEPAFCWSKNSPFAGTYALSIYAAVASDYGYWNASNPISFVVNNPYTFSYAVKGPGENFYLSDANNDQTTFGAASVWTKRSAIYTPTTSGTPHLRTGSGSANPGTYYFDNLAVFSGTTPLVGPVFSVPSDTRYGKRQVVQFGGLPVPVVGGTQSFIDIMDGANWFSDPRQPGVDIKIDRRLVSSPYVWRAKSVLQSEDYYPCVVTIPVLFDETNGNTFQAARAALFGAGSQYLTFDNLTGMVARLNAIQNLRMRISSQPYLWEGQLQFVGYEPWWRDFAVSSTDAKAITGTINQGTANYLALMQVGSIWTEPIFTLTIPVGNTAPILQFILLNSTSGEQISIPFAPVLAASTAWVLTIDCAAMTVTDQNGKQYDFAGSFPLLYGPAQTVNDFTATLVTSSGTTAGVTLAASWTSRWVP